MAKTSGRRELGARAGRLDAVEGGVGEVDRQGVEGDEAALGAGALEGEHVLAAASARSRRARASTSARSTPSGR